MQFAGSRLRCSRAPSDRVQDASMYEAIQPVPLRLSANRRATRRFVQSSSPYPHPASRLGSIPENFRSVVSRPGKWRLCEVSTAIGTAFNRPEGGTDDVWKTRIGGAVGPEGRNRPSRTTAVRESLLRADPQ